ncbi:MAG: sigma-70 family RNA polymerase sigma factor [Bryobacteraceae bacterium]|nr:sigma-70 family RNA polymerase sigma factor [Bryobacteraceae bacterium]
MRDENEYDSRLAAEYLSSRSEAAFRSLYRRHTPALLGMARRLSGGDGSAAEDLVQETWLRACRALGAFRWESALRTWLAGILVRCARERHRDAAREAELTQDPPAPRADRNLDVSSAIERLAPGFRMVLVLHDVEGYTHNEIGEMLGIEAGTSKSQLSRARRQLKSWIGQTSSTIR